VGFALPANEVASAVTQVQQHGKITRAFLGVRYVPITPAVQASNHLTVDHGVLVVRGDTPQDLAVTPGSGADKAGIVEGDIILQVDGVNLDDTHSLADAVKNKNVGDTISLVILHKGNQKTISVTLGALPQ
jgi:S1-C subfamily serine protease